MDEVFINVTENVEEVMVVCEEVMEVINVDIVEGTDVVIEVSETREEVDINVTESVEEVHVDIFNVEGSLKIDYKVWTMPSVGGTAYTGFATDKSAVTSEPKWAVKKLLTNGTETWAGKTTFDQILDNYLSLTYS